MGSEVDQASSLQPPQEDRKLEVRDEAYGTQVEARAKRFDLTQLKSFEILRSAVSVLTSNTKTMLVMVSSIIPLCASMIFYESKVQKTIRFVANFPGYHFGFDLVAFSKDGYEQYYDDVDRERREFFSGLLSLLLFYLVLYPLLEMFSTVVTMKLAAKAHAGEKQVSVRETLRQVKNDIKGIFVTCLCAHVLSAINLLSLSWIVAKCVYEFSHIEFFLSVVSIAFHSTIFVVLLYKYLGWSASWNTSIAISALGEESGLGAFAMSDYYGKHCSRTGFELMLFFFVFGNILRLPCLLSGLCDASVAGALVAGTVIGLVCLGNLVKWVAFVLYFYDCKQKTMEKKADEEVGKAGAKV